MNKIKRLTVLGILTAAALILSFIESLLPPIFSAVPGIKVGLCNIIIIFLIYRFSFLDAALVSIVRVVLTSALFGNGIVFLYSMSGAVLSLGFMGILKKTGKFSNVGVSVAGAVAHNLGQVIMAIFLLQTTKIAYYMIVLSLSGVLSGIAIGIISAYVLKYTQKFKL